MQRSLRSAKDQLGDEDYIYISIAAEPYLSNEHLASYANDNAFNWIFTVGTAELIEELTSRYGRDIIVTPNMVHFVIRADGTVSEMYRGSPSVAQLIQEIEVASRPS